MIKMWMNRNYRLNNLLRTFSSKLNPAKGDNKASINEIKPENIVGRFYQALLFKGRKENKLGLGDLKRLLQMCETQEHVKYAIGCVNVYQTKGSDFSEEICSHFVRACIRGQNPKAAAEIVSVYKYRMGAWITATSFHVLIEDLIKNQDNNEILMSTIDTVLSKGLVPAKDTADLLLKYLESLEELETKTKLKLAVEKIQNVAK